jgi:hypothetical protein
MNTDIESSSRDVTEELCDLIDRSLKVLKRSEAFYFILMKVGVLFFWCKWLKLAYRSSLSSLWQLLSVNSFC